MRKSVPKMGCAGIFLRRLRQPGSNSGRPRHHTIDVALAPASKSLGDVVVVGYLAQDRQNVSSAVGSLNVQEATRQPVPTNNYPVPTLAGRFTVELSGAAGVGESTVVEVVNSQGEAVDQHQFGPWQTTLAVETGLNADIYLVI